MDITLSEQQHAIAENVGRICDKFGDDYWSECDEQARFPEEFVAAMAAGGWLGITMPAAYGGSELGVVEAAPDEEGTLGVTYSDLIPVLINATKEQQAHIEFLRSENESLEERLKALEAKLGSQE